MTRPILTLLSLLALAASSFALADEKFEEASIRLEQNATDEDVEVVFEATSGDDGLAALRVSAPDGRVVIDFRSPDSKLGIRSFVLESPERINDGRIQAAFPAGVYTFAGSTVSGEKLAAKVTLSHSLPPTASFVRPSPKDLDIPVKGLQLKWGAPKGLASCIVILEHEKTGAKVLNVTLPGAATTLAVPDGLLVPGTEYKLEIGTVGRDGNRSFVETTFKTAGRK